MEARTLAFWESWASRYEYLVSQPFYLKPTREAVSRRVVEACPEARRILDVGCGVGQLCRMVAEAMPDAAITGLDPTWGMILRARSDYIHERVTYLHGEVRDLPADGRFDVVMTTHAFPYVREPEAFLARIAALMVPGGRLFLALACTESWWDTMVMKVVTWVTGPARYLPSREVERLVVSAGLRLDGVREIPVLPGIPSLRLVEAVK